MILLSKNHNRYQIFTIICLVILPLLLILSTIFFKQISLVFRQYTNNKSIGPQLVSFFQYIIFVVMLVLYPLLAALNSTKKYFEKIGPKYAIKEYENLKKIVYALFPFFIFGVVLLLSRVIGTSFLASFKFLSIPSVSYFLSLSVGTSFFIVASALLKILTLNSKRDFRFYFAKSWLYLCVDKKDDVETMRCFIKSINSYNAFIRRNLKLQITDLKMLYSKILSDSNVDKSRLIMELSRSFEDNNKLQTLKNIAKFWNITDTEHFLTKEPLERKFEHWATSLGTIVSAITAIIGAMVSVLPK